MTVLYVAGTAAQDSANPLKSAAVEAKPILQVPSADHRREWIELGTYVVLAGEPAEGAKKMHIVYTEWKNLEAYLKLGSFPDGTVLVKDMFVGKTGTSMTPRTSRVPWLPLPTLW